MILLDTNALLWMLYDGPRLGPTSRSLLASGDRIAFSSVSVVELVVKQMLGKLKLPADAREAALAAGLYELALDGRHAAALAAFPELARHDPFDRMLLAQASTEGVQLLTSDRALLGLDYEWLFDARR